MPRKSKRPCRFPGCPNLTDGIYCEEHAKVMERHYEKFQRSYSPANTMAGTGSASATGTSTSTRFVSSA